MKNFFSTLIKIILRCFTREHIFWQFIAVALTYIIVITNLDWYYFISTRSSIFWYAFLPAIILGGILPIVIPIILIIHGHITKRKNIMNTGWLLGKAAIVGSIISSTYKFFTGRVQPDLHNITLDISRGFNFGFFKHGIFWGWPSSHTTIAFAMAVTLILLYPKNKLLKVLSIIYAFYVAIGVSFSIHWLSEAVAGVFIGSVVGASVVAVYKSKLVE